MIGLHTFRAILSIVTAWMLVSASASPEAPALPVVLTATPWMQEMSEGGPVAIRLKIRNLSDSPVVINLGEDEKEGILILLTSSNGKIYSSKWMPKEGLSLIGKVTIPPAAEAERIFILEDWNIVPAPGVYNTTLSFKYSANGKNSSEFALPNLSFATTVGIRDSSRIRQECNIANSLYMSATNYTEAASAVSLLSRFRDKSALDCLSKAYFAKRPYHFEYQLIHAIGNINSEAARQILNDIAKSDKEEDAAIARAVLRSHEPH